MEADTVTLNTALNTGRDGSWEAMGALLVRARVATLQADAFTYSAAFRAIENISRWQSALLLTRDFTVKGTQGKFDSHELGD